MESVTTAKANAVFFIVFLFSFGNVSAEHAYSLHWEGIFKKLETAGGRHIMIQVDPGTVSIPPADGAGLLSTIS